MEKHKEDCLCNECYEAWKKEGRVSKSPPAPGLGRMFMTADNVPILLGMKVYVVNEDKEYFGDDDILEQTIKTLDLAKGFSGYKGDITVGSEDWEGGNLDCYAAKQNLSA